jgi:hypothetical protein
MSDSETLAKIKKMIEACCIDNTREIEELMVAIKKELQ